MRLPCMADVCEGVTNGVARGNAHPVPKCFRDETDASKLSMAAAANGGAKK